MTMDLCWPRESKTYTHFFWRKLTELALANGWRPAGTLDPLPLEADDCDDDEDETWDETWGQGPGDRPRPDTRGWSGRSGRSSSRRTTRPWRPTSKAAGAG